ncbi:MAG: dynamin family protein [Jaaginema sp. PMC 1079.18]|nr:dynamin family protein [Jaaginema sp. PMC 1079.18]
MDRPAKIASIIAQRQPLVPKIEQVERNLQFLVDALNQLEKHRNQLLEKVDDAQAKKDLKKIDFPSRQRETETQNNTFQDEIEEQIKALSRLKSHFSRNTLNIGVIGVTGAGKSTLLQTLSGLSNNEIPALEGGACTAVRSKITNRKGSTTAEVSFYSEDSFLKEVIYPYYHELNFDNHPKSIDEFINSPLPEYSGSSVIKKEIYRHLKNDYYENMPRIKHLLKENNPRIVNQADISNYVSHQGSDNGLDSMSCDHWAVKEVNIFCPFAETDVEQITLVDLPGIGDTLIGDKKLMLETLSKEVDIVIFLENTPPKRYLWKDGNLKMYDNA